MILETNRLQIIALTPKQFELLLNDKISFEKEVGFQSSCTKWDDDTTKAMIELHQECVKHSQNYWWFTNWQIVLKAENKVVGSACFMKEPDEDGFVEIGYGTDKPYQNKGIMSEAAKALCDWALSQQNVRGVIAQAEKENFASHKVIERCGMQLVDETENLLVFRRLK